MLTCLLFKEMIGGIGTDIIEVSRIQAMLEKDESFASKIYSADEIAYCDAKKKNKYESYAARFAAKEAFFKALGTGRRGSMSLTEVEVVNDELGKPVIRISGDVKDFFEKEKFKVSHISISHVKEYATAFVVFEK